MKIEIDDTYQIRFSESELKRGMSLLEKLPNRLSELENKQFITSYITNMALGNDCWILVRDGNFWVVSYLERGSRFGPAFFWFIEDAIHFFLFKLTGTVVNVNLRE